MTVNELIEKLSSLSLHFRECEVFLSDGSGGVGWAGFTVNLYDDYNRAQIDLRLMGEWYKDHREKDLFDQV